LRRSAWFRALGAGVADLLVRVVRRLDGPIAAPTAAQRSKTSSPSTLRRCSTVVVGTTKLVAAPAVAP
jgi:hypothetical protein